MTCVPPPHPLIPNQRHTHGHAQTHTGQVQWFNPVILPLVTRQSIFLKWTHQFPSGFKINHLRHKRICVIKLSRFSHSDTELIKAAQFSSGLPLQNLWVIWDFRHENCMFDLVLSDQPQRKTKVARMWFALKLMVFSLREYLNRISLPP